MTLSNDDMETAAQRPKKTQGDEGMIEEKNIEEMIKADRYTKQSSATGPPFGMQVSRAKFPGTVQ